MSAVDVLLKERAALCDTLAETGPDAPTLCVGWLTADLSAHVLAREKRPDAAAGIILPGPFARHMQKVMDEYKAKGYEPMLDELRQGPPKYFRVGPMAALNVVENWIHHEDVRRANGQGPRPADAEVDEILWASLKSSSFIAKRKLKGAGLLLKSPDGRERLVKQADPVVVVTGPPGELVLFMSGRQEAADVHYEGAPEAIALVRATKLGI
jgi:uncharacterized protein (TIGR03085 family)